MLELKFDTSERKLDLPKYRISEPKRIPIPKSTFVDSNRVDTVQPAFWSDNKENDDEDE